MLKTKFIFKLLMSLLLMALAVPLAQAKTVDVNGTTSTNQVPLNAMYGDYGYHSQMVYSQAILEDAGLPAGAKITAITFYTASDYNLTTSSGSENNPLTIKLGQPSSSTLSAFITDGLTTVSTTGNIWSGGTSVTLEFDSDKAYTYDGENLLIDISSSLNSNGYYKTIYWLASSVTSASRYANNNSSGVEQSSTSSNYLPKITLTYEVGELEPYASKLTGVTGDSYDFGSLAVGLTKTLNLTLKNTGANPFTPSVSINDGALNSIFSTTYVGQSIAAGETVTIPVTFNPATAGDFTGTMTIDCGLAGSYTINLTGSAVLEVILAEGTEYNEYVPVYGYNHDSYNQTNQMVYPSSMLTSLQGKKLKSITFYPAEVASYYSTTKGINFKNGSATISLATAEAGTITYSASGNTRQQPDNFTTVGTISIPSTAQTDLTEWTITFGENGFIYTGGDLLVDVSTEKGSYGRTYFYGQTTESYTSIYNSSATALSGQQFLPKVKFAYEDATDPVTVPTITVNPAILTINAALGETKTATFTVTGANLEDDITVAASEGFTVNPTTIEVVDGNANATVTVTYVAPATAETKTGTITLTSANAETKTVAVTATAAEVTYDFTVEPTTLNFGTVNLGQNTKLQVKITNNGSDNFTPTFTFANGTDVFTIEDPREVVGGTSQYFDVTFTPAVAGNVTDKLIITIGTQTVEVNLTGVGHEVADYDIASSVASGVHNFGDAHVNGSATWNFTLTNNGKEAVTPTITGLEAPFSTTYTPAALAAGESVTITISFNPTEIQAYGPTSIVVSFPETEDFQFDYTLRGNGIENTGTLPPSAYDAITYTWTDANGDEHTSKLNEIATDPDQMIALMREVYTNKNLPGPWYRGYDADGNVETAYPVPYPAIGKVTRFGAFGVTENYTYDGSSNGWNIPHDEANYPFDLLYHNSSSHYYYKALNANEYKPNEEGLTLLLVEMKDGVTSSTVSNTASLRNVFSGMFKSVRVITNSKKITNNNGVEGTLFKIDCDKMNRFFFLGKGRLRLYNDAYVDNTHLLGRSNFFIDKDNQTSSSQSITNVTDDKAPFYEMFEQFSPVSLTQGTEAQDIYQELVNMVSYPVEHDCEYIPWATTQSSSGASITGHEFNMYGKESISDDCQDVRDLMFFVPDQRMKYWGTRDKGANDKFVNYYEEYAPTMGLYVIRQNEITGEKKTYEGNENNYELHLTWDSNLTDFVPSDKGVYYIYQVNDDGTYTLVGQTDSQTKELYVNVAMQEHGQQVTYVIQGMDNTGFLSLQMSNEESFIIPGTNPYAKFQLDPRADFYSRFNPADEYNYYANGMELSGYADATSDMYVGKTVYFYRKPVTITENGTTEGEWTKFAEVTPSSATSAGLATFDQRTLAQYQYGYKANASTLTIDNNVFTEFYDNFRADVSSNEHPDLYKYIMVVDGTPAEIAIKYHSNEISVKVYKTTMRNLTGTFDDDYVNADVVRQDVDKNTQFDIDVEHSSKTEVLRYCAYRWASNEEKAILASEDEDISPSGQASNQGEYYTVYMNGDSYIGQDVYVAQGETGQATFLDDVPANATNADEYTYAPVVETFTGRVDYNTYGAPMQTTATGKITVAVEKQGMSEYTWEANGNNYRYYNVFVYVSNLDLPEGYEVAKVRAWRKIDSQYLGEQAGNGYTDRLNLDVNGEYKFDEKATTVDNDKLGYSDEPVNGVYPGTFGALDVETEGAIPMKFFVRIYFKKSSGSKAAGDEYYITEVEVDGTLDSQIPTSIFGVESYKVVTGIKYYNMAGVESEVPFQGVNIEVTTYDDGSRSTRKIIK